MCADTHLRWAQIGPTHANVRFRRRICLDPCSHTKTVEASGVTLLIMGPLPMLALAVVVAATSLPALDDPWQLPPAETSTVFVDVVVRDGKGRPVTDLTAADFEVREDGTLQTLGQFLAPAAEPASCAA